MLLLGARAGRSVGQDYMQHKFKIDQMVRFVAGPHERHFGGLYKIVSHMPAERGEFQYRIKSSKDAHERVVREGQISGT